MNKKDVDRINSRISILKNLKVRQISRIGSMMSIGFGDEIVSKKIYKNDDGKLDVRETISSQYAIDIDGFFRISDAGEIILSKDDMFRPNSFLKNSCINEEGFEWDVEGNNKFDENKESINRLNLSVQDIIVNELGDLKIVLSNNFLLEVLIDTNEDEECWRFFEVGNDEKTHIIVAGSRFYEQ